MPIHDWTRVDRALFHSFYLGWVSGISSALNCGVLPSTHYSLCENHRDGKAATFATFPEPTTKFHDPGHAGAIRYRSNMEPHSTLHDVCTHPEYAEKVITVRHCADHGVEAAIRIVAAETKRSRYRLDAFTAWAVEVLRDGISLLIVDLFPPGNLNPNGIHKLIWDEFVDNDFTMPSGKSATLVSYASKPVPEAFVDVVCVGDALPDTPLFLDSNGYVPTPLEVTYQTAFKSMPKYWQDVMNGKEPS